MGYVFINAYGQYAEERPNTGFGSERTVICWSDDINSATVWTTPNPRNKPEGAVATLKAEVSRTVTLVKEDTSE